MAFIIETTEKKYVNLISDLTNFLNRIEVAPFLSLNYRDAHINLSYCTDYSLSNISTPVRITRPGLGDIHNGIKPSYKIDVVMSNVFDDYPHMVMNFALLYANLVWGLSNHSVNPSQYSEMFSQLHPMWINQFIQAHPIDDGRVVHPDYKFGKSNIVKMEGDQLFDGNILPTDPHIIDYIFDELIFLRGLKINRDIVFRLIKDPTVTHIGYCYWHPKSPAVIDICLMGREQSTDRIFPIQFRQIKVTISHEIGHLIYGELSNIGYPINIDRELFADAYALLRGHSLHDICAGIDDPEYQEKVLDAVKSVTNSIMSLSNEGLYVDT